MIVLAEPELRVLGLGDHVVPAWLRPRDEVWVRELLAEIDPLVGSTLDDVDTRLGGRAAAIARAHGVSARALAGVRRVIGHVYRSTVVSVAPPPRLREVLFGVAAEGPVLDRDAAIARAAERLGIERDALLDGLFADRPGARRLVAPASAPSPADVVAAYNLALLRGLLARCTEARVRVRSHVRSVVRFAKLARLICTYVLGDGGTTVSLSGPLSLFRHTAKYGHAIARFVPAVLSTPDFALVASVVLGERRVVVRVGAADPLPRPHALPREADSSVERRLVRDVRKLGRGYTIEREAAAIPVGGGVCFPDFTLCKGTARVLVEVVGFYTPEYLASKLRAIHAVRERHPLLVLVDESLACADAELAGAAVVRYRSKVDAAALLDAADALFAPSRPA